MTKDNHERTTDLQMNNIEKYTAKNENRKIHQSVRINTFEIKRNEPVLPH